MNDGLYVLIFQCISIITIVYLGNILVHCGL
jgi:hypothetical protein